LDTLKFTFKLRLQASFKPSSRQLSHLGHIIRKPLCLEKKAHPRISNRARINLSAQNTTDG